MATILSELADLVIFIHLFNVITKIRLKSYHLSWSHSRTVARKFSI